MTAIDASVTPIQPGERLPLLRASLATGGELRPSAYRGWANLALFVLPDAADPRAAETLAGVAAHLAGFRERHAQPLAIVGGALDAVSALQERLGLPYPLAADPDGALVARLAPRDAAGRPLPTALLTDRYGEVRTVLTGWAALQADHLDDLLEWLNYIDCLCSV
jgi:peroxiredoxin